MNAATAGTGLAATIAPRTPGGSVNDPNCKSPLKEFYNKKLHVDPFYETHQVTSSGDWVQFHSRVMCPAVVESRMGQEEVVVRQFTAEGFGRSKKDAEQEAAANALQHIAAVAPALGVPAPPSLRSPSSIAAPSTLAGGSGGSAASDGGRLGGWAAPTPSVFGGSGGSGGSAGPGAASPPSGAFPPFPEAPAAPSFREAESEFMGPEELRAELLAALERERRLKYRVSRMEALLHRLRVTIDDELVQ